jgi:hypothetical protein
MPHLQLTSHVAAPYPQSAARHVHLHIYTSSGVYEGAECQLLALHRPTRTPRQLHTSRGPPPGLHARCAQQGRDSVCTVVPMLGVPVSLSSLGFLLAWGSGCPGATLVRDSPRK